MCGRYALTTPPDVLAAFFRLSLIPEYSLRYNVAPTQMSPIVRLGSASPGRELTLMRWGLIPSWAKDAAIGNRLINARSDSAASKPAFRSAFKRRRCVVPASGFFEWKAPKDAANGAAKQPYYIFRADGDPLALAGLFESWRPSESDDWVLSFTILTTDANAAMASIHDRMPVILEPEDLDRWIDPNVTDASAVSDLLKPAADGVLTMHPVSTRVNSPRNESPDLVAPLGINNSGVGDLFGGN